MPIVRPMRALRYGSDHLHLLPELMSPAVRGEPVDRTVVGDVHPLCVRQLVRGGQGPKHDPDFSHTGHLIRRWKEQGVLVRDPRPAIYIYEQEQGDRIRRGLVALVRLAPLGAGPVLAHEVSSGPSTARLLAQLRATQTQLSLVMAMVPDDDHRMTGYLQRMWGRPLAKALDGHGTINRIWRDEVPASQLALLELLAERPAVIADGHHRYAAALAHQQEVRAAAARPGRERPADYVMMLLVPASDPGLHSEPTHRVCPRLCDGAEELLAGLHDRFEVTDLDSEQELVDFLAGDEGVRFGLVRPGQRTGLRLRTEPGLLDRLPETLRRVDAAIADELLLSRLADSIGQSGASGSAWAHNAASARAVATRAFAGEIPLTLLLRPTPPGQVLDVALAGELMPPKSTNFVPKPAKGLLLNSLFSF
jgi:hypothetical protein